MDFTPFLIRPIQLLLILLCFGIIKVDILLVDKSKIEKIFVSLINVKMQCSAGRQCVLLLARNHILRLI